MNEIIQLFIFGIILTSLVMIYQSNYSSLIYVKSEVDRETYLVQRRDDSQDAADLLGSLKQNLSQLINIMKEKYPNDKRVIRLKNRFNPDNISESLPGSQYTSYSVNKGEKLVFCIRKKNTQELIKLNTIIFVAIHELAHLMSISIGHTEEFWNNMRFILKVAIKHKIYKEQDFKNKPEPYCGIKITSSPLNN